MSEMFCVVYRFEVKPGREAAFEASWADLTRALYRHCGSLGSRLHRSAGGEYLAYAQWPSRERWAGARLPGAFDAVRERLRASCLRTETLYQLTPVSDLLRDRPAGED